MIDASTFEHAPAGAVTGAEGRSAHFVTAWWNMEKALRRCRGHEERLARGKEWIDHVEELLALEAINPDEARLFVFRLADIFRLERIYLSRTQGGRLWQVLERVRQYEAAGVTGEVEEYPGLVEDMTGMFRDILRDALHELGQGDLAEAYFTEPEDFERLVLAAMPRVKPAVLSQALGQERARDFDLERAKLWSQHMH